MVAYKKYSMGWLALTMLLILGACQRETSEETNRSNLTVAISHEAAGAGLVLNSDVTTPLGEVIRYTSFKYYLSGFELLNVSGTTTSIPNQYILVDEANPASKQFALQIPAGSYTGIRFTIGVDSARNVSGVQEGALDPANGMFWTWNTGYIMAKLEGKSPVSTAPLSNVTYHIGGFGGGNNSLRTVTITFPEPIAAGSQGGIRVAMMANVDAWFRGAHEISVATENLIMEPGPAAMRLADNYARMFSLIEATAE